MKRTRNTAYISALLFLLFFKGALPAGSYPLISQSTDWRETGEVTRIEQGLLLVLFVSDDCNYCKRLKTEYLYPVLQQKNKPLVMREVNIDKGGKMTDFDGIPIRSRLFASRYDIFATPTLTFLDSRGKVLTAPIIGYDDLDSYQFRMQKALSNSRIVLEKKARLH